MIFLFSKRGSSVLEESKLRNNTEVEKSDYHGTCCLYQDGSLCHCSCLGIYS